MSREVLDICVDWTGCDLVERAAGKMSGLPVVRGSLILADAIVQDAELGISLGEIHAKYPDLALMTIRQLISFSQRQRALR